MSESQKELSSMGKEKIFLRKDKVEEGMSLSKTGQFLLRERNIGPGINPERLKTMSSILESSSGPWRRDCCPKKMNIFK